MSRIVISPDTGPVMLRPPVSGFMTVGRGTVHPDAGQHTPSLDVCECFCEAFQGEGAYSGVPAVFLRLSGCPLACRWCDTRTVWTKQYRIGCDILSDIFLSEGIDGLLDRGHHLVITGGSPLMQQDALVLFLDSLFSVCTREPFVEIENECSITVSPGNMRLFELIRCWNCSPKLSGSGVPESVRFNPAAISQVAGNASEIWFKFVADPDRLEYDWQEILEKFIEPGLVSPSQVILMPMGASRAELTPERCRRVAEFAVAHDVRYGDRLHVNLYDTRKSV